MSQTDVVIVGGGLAGLVAADELATRGRRVVVVDQEGPQSLGGQAFWSLGGLFMVDTPEQRRMGIRDSRELAWSDWLGSAAFDGPDDVWARRWAEAYVDFAAGEMRSWLHGIGFRWFPVVGWAERGGRFADGHGNSVPRFHVTWGTGPGVVEPFVERVREHERTGNVECRYRHRVTEISCENGRVVGVAGVRLAEDDRPRGEATARDVVGEFRFEASSVIVAAGGIGGAPDRVRRAWPVERLGPAPDHMLTGVPAHVDGSMHDVAASAGARVVNEGRMWHYTEGITNWAPIWPDHGIRILPGPSSLWLDADGRRLPPPCLPGFDTLATLRHILSTGRDTSWFVLTQSIIEKEFALSGSEQNPDLTSKRWIEVAKSRLGGGAPAPVEAFKANGEDFVVADDLDTLVRGMNRVAGDERLDPGAVRRQLVARDAQLDNAFTKDAQLMAIQSARRYRGDRWIRTATPHRLLDPSHGPLIAVRLHVLTRKSLGGLQTNLDGQVIGADGRPIAGLFAVGECAGFGGGGLHGMRALEGTFLGGCIFTGRQTARALG